jgi:hypothetical protein
MKSGKKILIVTPFFFLIFLLWPSIQPWPVVYQEPKFGVSFSPRQARYLGLDNRESYLAILDNLQPLFIRIPVYWDEVQEEKGCFDFTDFDWMLTEAKKRRILVTLNLGYTLFRYPECYEPRWAWDLEGEEFNQALLTFLRESVTHFADFTNVEAWQVENERELWMDKHQCRVIRPALFLREIETVRQSDRLSRPILITHGGKTAIPALWQERVLDGDIFGVSFFPKNYNRHLQIYTSNLWFRNLAMERTITEKAGRRFWVSEFQAEAWGRTPLNQISSQEARETMTPAILTQNLNLLKEKGGAERVYLWGVEWWHKERLEGREEMWEAGKSLLKEGW